MSKKTFTLQELAILTESTVIGDPDYHIDNVESLELATSRDASFLANPRYEKAMLKSKAGVVFVATADGLPSGRNFLLTSDPSKAFQRTAEAFYGTGNELSGFEGIHPTAVIHPSALLGKECTVGPHAVIDKNVVVGNSATIGAGCYIGPNVKIGHFCLFHPRVTIREQCVIGDRVVLQSGVVIGGCGFGYLTDKEGRHTKLNQLGCVTIGDDVEIGANTTIDRSRFKDTRIGRGTKIDNLVQIGHGVSIGEDNIIVAQTGIAGSTKTGNNVTIGGQVAIAGHLHICDRVMIAGRSGVTKSLTKPGVIYAGIPARPRDEHNRATVYLQNIEPIIKKIDSRLDLLEKNNKE